MAVIYVCDKSGQLGTVDTGTGAVTVIGPMGVVMTDIAFAPNGKLYGISYTKFYEINPATGVATEIGPLGAGGMVALAFDGNGKAYAASNANANLYTIALATGAASVIGAIAAGVKAAGDLAFHEGNLLLSTDARNVADINHVTGAQELSVFHGITDLLGLVSTGVDQLWAFTGTQLGLLNEDAGWSILVQDFTGQGLDQIWGAAFNGNFFSPLNGTGTANAITGSAKVEWIQGLGGDDTISALGGNDWAEGGLGRDKIDGGDGNDRIWGHAQAADNAADGGDTLTGGLGNDTISGQSGTDSIDGGDGNDSLMGDAGADTVLGGLGNDTVNGGAAADTLNGGAGADSLHGGDGTDSLLGGAGIDTLRGGTANDILKGEGDADVIDGGLGSDTLTGGGGGDRFVFANAGTGGPETDIITDYSKAAGDVIDIIGPFGVLSTAVVAGNLVITLAGGDADKIRVEGVTSLADVLIV